MSANNDDINFTLGHTAVLTFKNLNSSHPYSIGEFVDNSIQSYLDNKEELHKTRDNYKALIEIDYDKDDKEISIKDNCGGISDEDAIRAFTLGHPNPNKKGIGTSIALIGITLFPSSLFLFINTLFLAALFFFLFKKEKSTNIANISIRY